MASATERIWKRALRDLEATGARYAVVGAVAAGVHGRIRTTKDIDVAVDVADDTEAEAVVRSLVARGYVADSLIEQTGTGRIAAVRFVAPGSSGDDPDLDVLFASCGIEPEIVAAAERAVLMRGLESPVASRGRSLERDLDRLIRSARRRRKSS